MSYFAKVLDKKVINVIVAEQEFFETFVDSSPGAWIETSSSTHGNQNPEGTPLRGNYAGIGYTYDATKDVFYAPAPYPSWVLNETTYLWENPVPYPMDGKVYLWDEETLSYVEEVVEV